MELLLVGAANLEVVQFVLTGRVTMDKRTRSARPFCDIFGGPCVVGQLS